MIRDFGERGLAEVAGILERIQQAEKEKLELTVQWQVLTQQERERGENEELEDFGAADYKKSELRKKYSTGFGHQNIISMSCSLMQACTRGGLNC